MFLKTKKWNDSVKKLQNNEITVQQFVDLNDKMVLYYSTPLGTDKDGKNCVYAMKNHINEFTYFPAFSTKDACKSHFDSANRDGYLIIKGDLRGALHSLDSHPMFSEWGLVINPTGQIYIGIPPHIRVRPKCLQDWQTKNKNLCVRWKLDTIKQKTRN